MTHTPGMGRYMFPESFKQHGVLLEKNLLIGSGKDRVPKVQMPWDHRCMVKTPGMVIGRPKQPQ